MKLPADSNRNKTRPDGPRRVRNGLRLRRKEDQEGWKWPASTWAERLIADPPAKAMETAPSSSLGSASHFPSPKLPCTR